MKFFANKKITQKIVITILLILSFNFIIPKPIHANIVEDAIETAGDLIGGFILNPFLSLLTSITDAAFNAVQDFMLGNDNKFFFMVSRDDTDQYYGLADRK